MEFLRMEIIEWPNWWKGNGKHFLQGIPIWGPETRIYKEAERILRLRETREVEMAWAQRGYDPKEVASFLNRVYCSVEIYLIKKWPNLLFLPEDNAFIFLEVNPILGDDCDQIVKVMLKSFVFSRTESEYFLECVEKGKALSLVDLYRLCFKLGIDCKGCH